jgi:hypothetical protein
MPCEFCFYVYLGFWIAVASAIALSSFGLGVFVMWDVMSRMPKPEIKSRHWSEVDRD